MTTACPRLTLYSNSVRKDKTTVVGVLSGVHSWSTRTAVQDQLQLISSHPQSLKWASADSGESIKSFPAPGTCLCLLVYGMSISLLRQAIHIYPAGPATLTRQAVPGSQSDTASSEGYASCRAGRHPSWKPKDFRKVLTKNQQCSLCKLEKLQKT